MQGYRVKQIIIRIEYKMKKSSTYILYKFMMLYFAFHELTRNMGIGFRP